MDRDEIKKRYLTCLFFDGGLDYIEDAQQAISGLHQQRIRGCGETAEELVFFGETGKEVWKAEWASVSKNAFPEWPRLSPDEMPVVQKVTIREGITVRFRDPTALESNARARSLWDWIVPILQRKGMA